MLKYHVWKCFYDKIFVSMTLNEFLLFVQTEFLSYIILDHSRHSFGLYNLGTKLAVSKILKTKLFFTLAVRGFCYCSNR